MSTLDVALLGYWTFVSDAPMAVEAMRLERMVLSSMVASRMLIRYNSL